MKLNKSDRETLRKILAEIEGAETTLIGETRMLRDFSEEDYEKTLDAVGYASNVLAAFIASANH